MTQNPDVPWRDETLHFPDSGAGREGLRDLIDRAWGGWTRPADDAGIVLAVADWMDRLDDWADNLASKPAVDRTMQADLRRIAAALGAGSTDEVRLDVERLAQAEYVVDQGNEFDTLDDARLWAVEVAREYGGAGSTDEDAAERPYCTQRGPRGYLCTEPLGHEGDHVARGHFNHEGEYERWSRAALTDKPSSEEPHG